MNEMIAVMGIGDVLMIWMMIEMVMNDGEQMFPTKSFTVTRRIRFYLFETTSK